jgi:hypothetical protein
MIGGRVARAVAWLAFLMGLGCGSGSQPRLIDMSPPLAATSESGEALVFRAELQAGETATWSLDPGVGALVPWTDGGDPTGARVTYTPPSSVDRRDAATAATLVVTTSNGRGTASIEVYPDPCGAGGRWTASGPLDVPGPPAACGPCGPGAVAYGDATPPANALLGGTVPQGRLTETFDLPSCTWTVTAPEDGSVNDFCTWGTVTPPYAGLVASFTFARGQDTVTGQQRWVCWGATACCAPLLDVTLVRQ